MTNPTNQTVNFGNVAVDGIGGAFGTASVTLTNNGSGPLTVSQNGITVGTGPFSITGITSSTQGAINLATGSATIAAGSAETWTVALKFDPTATGLVQVPLTILSNAPEDGTVVVSLLGTGATAMHLAAPGGPLSFGSVPADGPGKQLATQTVLLTNTGQLPLQINQNGITLATGTQFKIAGVSSSTQGAINLSSGPATLAASSAETWTVTLQFDPSAAGTLSDTLRIASNDPVSPTTSIALSGTGLNQPVLVVTDSGAPNNLNLGFPATLDDGPGGRSATQTVQLTNIGTQPLVVSQNGIVLAGGTNFQVVSVVSSVSGAVNLAGGSATLAAMSAETWTVTLRFDPLSTGSLADTLSIASNDPVNPTVSVALTGQGVVPVVSAVYPAQTVHVSAGWAYHITWNGTYAPGTGSYALYYDTDRNPALGLVAIATGLPQTQTAYDWQAPTSLVGGTYTIYVTLQDGTVAASSYASGSLTVDPLGSDRLLSAPVTATAAYTLSYSYNTTTYTAPYALSMGDNALYPTGGGVTHEYHVFLAATLVDSDSTGYDSLGNVTSTTDANGQIISYVYDQLSRVTHISYPDGTGVDYTYDAASNLLTMHDATGWQLYGYDVLDRLTSVTYSPTNNASDPAALSIGYGYDADNRLTALTYPSGKVVQYGYDNASKLTSVTEKNAGQADLVTTYAYDATTGLLKTETRPDDTQTVYSYDTNGQLIDILHRRTSTQALILEYHYTLDAAGRHTQVVTTTPSGATAQAYVYDDMNRLVQVTYSNDNGTIDPTDEVVQYGYDGNSNRLTQTTYANGVAAGATQTLTYAYGFANRLLTVTDQNGVVQEAYSYDWRGNQVEKVTPTATTIYGYDERNLLVSVDDGTNHITYQYDGAGRRISQTVNGVTTQFVVDPSNADYQTLEELTGAGAVNAAYTYGLDRISGLLPGQANATCYLSDALGSVGGLVSNTGSALGNYTYDAFGQVLTSPASVNNAYTFAGERLDQATGLIDLRAREYDPSTGRFPSEDPLGFADSTNTYMYGFDAPTVYSDPTGESITITITGGAGAGAFAGKGVGEGASVSGAAGVAIDILNPLNSRIITQVSGAKMMVGAGAGAGAGGQFSVGLSTEDLYTGLNYDVAAHAEVSGGIGPIKAGLAADINGRSGTISAAPPAWGVEAGAYGAGGVSGTVTYASPTLGEAAGAVIGAIFGQTQPQQPPDTGAAVAGPDVLGPTWNYTQETGFTQNPGGVLIDQAATLVGSDIKDIAGATYDPTSHQLVFLGNSNPATLHNVNLDLFTTAIQTVYGSLGPPYVTLDPLATLVQQSFNLGDGDGVVANGKTAGIVVHYAPYTSTEADDMTLSFDVNGASVTARLDGYQTNIYTGWGRAMGLTTLSVTGLPAGWTLTMPAKNVFGPGTYLSVNSQGEDSYWTVSLQNNSGSTATVTNLLLIPDLQERKFGGRVDNTRLGWIMEEADRVLKELGGGKDQLTGAIYNSQNTALPAGFQNLLERYVAANQSGNFSNRFWFTPNEETLESYIDPVTGEATVVFSQSSVKLNTEALILGQPEDPTARAFADWFNANYDAMANISFPVHDPTDPTGTRVIQEKIFQDLEDAMKAVSLARFFHDNNIPLNTWWINSYTPPTAYIPLTIPTLTNSLQNGSVTVSFYGGVTIKTPNTYVPAAVAQSIAADVLAQRTAGTGDLAVQAWNVTNTPVGNLNAVAASLDDQQQSGAITLGATDLSFASPGGEQLTFQRYYNSSYLGSSSLGLGWQANQFSLQFQYPSMVDNYGLMRDGSGNQVPVYGAIADTYLRSGEIRLMDQSTGQFLNFFSSLTTVYALDGGGNPILSTSGLTSNDVPTFSPGQYQDGSTLTQASSTHNYTLTQPDGSTLVFDPQGNLLSTTDARGYTITYNYTNGQLSKITDTGGQALTITYGSNGLIQYVAGPDNTTNPQRRIAYVYDSSNRLIEVDKQVLQSGSTYTTASSTEYQYNATNQISGVVGPNGLTTLTGATDVRGRSTQSQNVLGNMVDYGYTQNVATGATTTQATDMGTTGGNDPTAQGVAALQYFAAGSTSTTQFDSTARTTQTTNALGNTTQYGYTAGSLLPNTVTLPTPNRPSISIQRNAANLPTVINDPANTGGSPVQITYNAANLPTQTTDAKGLVTKYTYTAWNDVATVAVGFGTLLAATTTYNYNAQKLLQSVVDPLGHTVASYTYDSLGRVLTMKDGDNITTTYAYDSLSHLTRVYEPQLTGSMTYIAFTYNNNDQVTQETTPTGNITDVYDPTTHRLTSVTDLTGATTQYGYDPSSGLLTSITQVHSGGNAVTQEVYDRRGQLVLLIAPNGVRTAFRSDSLGRPTDVIEDDGTSPSAGLNVQVTSPTTVTVTANASEPILVASLEYWQSGQPESTALTQSVRLSDQKSFTFNLTGLDTTQPYNYKLTQTDLVGLAQTLAITTTTVTSSASPSSVFGQSVTFTATVIGTSFDNGGTVTFSDGSTSLGTASLSDSGLATITNAALAVAGSPHTIWASYSGDTNFTISSGSVLQAVNQASTSTLVTSSTTASLFGQSVTFTATVSPQFAGTFDDGGTVTFSDGSTSLGTTSLSGATATFSTTTTQLSGGTHTITASYSGDTNFTTSSGSVLQTVSTASTCTSVTSSTTASVYGQSVTFTATVTAGSVTFDNGGTVTFSDGSTSLGTTSLSCATATFSTTTTQLSGGTHTITASYSDDTNFTTSGGSVLQTVSTASTSTSVTLSTSASVFGQSVTFTATVSPQFAGTFDNGGTVTFSDGSTSLGTASLSDSGLATITNAALAVAGSPHTIWASYSGDTNFTTSSGSVLQTVNQASTTTSVTSSTTASVYGQSVTFTATVSVTSPGAGMPTGTVTFNDGGMSIGTGAVTNGTTATFTPSSLTVSTHTISAVYGGDLNFSSSTSGNFLQTVNQPTTTTTVTNASNPSVFGQSLAFTATVSITSPGAGMPSGTVTFKDNGMSLGTAALSSGSATWVTSSLSVGTHTIGAAYGGDMNFRGSTTTTAGTITTVAGIGVNLYSGDGGFATAVPLSGVYGVAVDASGNIYITNSDYPRIREVSVSTGIITTIAGNHTWGYSGDGGPATTAQLKEPYGVAVDASGNIYIADYYDSRIREVSASTGVITTVAGDGSWAYGGDRGPATAAQLRNPWGVAVDGIGNIYIADFGNGRIREVSASTGVITTVAGGGSSGLGDDGPATAAQLYGPTGVALDASGNIYIADMYGNRIREVSASTGIITTVAGNGYEGYSGDDGPATAAELVYPMGVAVDASGNIYIADYHNNCIREVSASTGIITTVAGNGVWAYGGDGGPATAAQVWCPADVAVDASGNIYIAEQTDARIREVAAGTTALTQTVTKAATMTTVSSSVNASLFGQSVTITATVSVVSPGGGTITGTVTFQDGGISIGMAALTGGTSATFTVSNFSVTTHTITAVYGGDTNFTGSSSTNLLQTVNQASTGTTVTSSPNPSAFGQSVTFTATVSAQSPGGGMPTGTVMFMEGASQLGLGALAPQNATTWTTVASMSTARYSPAAALGSDGRIYAIGGDNNLATVEAYTLGSNTWTTVASMPTARGYLAAVAGEDGRIYAIGGYNNGYVLSTVEAYTPGSDTWTTVASMPTARWGLAAVAGSDGLIYAIGGDFGNGALGTVEAYTPVTNTWSTVASMPFPCYGLAAALGNDGRIYAMGGTAGSIVQAYTPVANTWSTVASMPTGRCYLAAVAGSDGRIYAIGGCITSISSPVKTVEAYTPGSNTWTTDASMPTARCFPAVALGVNGRIYAIGGYNGSRSVTTLEALNFSMGATFSTNTLALGSHSITVIYSGDTNFTTSSGNLLQTVNQASTSTSVTSSTTASVFGQSVTFTATVSPQFAGTFDNGGTVTFSDGSTSLGTASLSGGEATYSAPSSVIDTVTTHTITASYSGDTNFSGSSGSMLQTVNTASTSTTVTSSTTASVFGQSVTFTATVSPQFAGTFDNGGTVTFSDGSTSLGTASLSSGPGHHHRCRVDRAGSPHTIWASFSGDTNFTTSSGSVLQTVNAASTCTSVTSSTSAAVFGQSVSFTATVSPQFAGTFDNGGTVTFSDGSTSLGTAILSSDGLATITDAALTVTGSPHTIWASYSGDTNFTTSSGSVLQTVNAASTCTSVTSSTSAAVFGQSVTFTATVSPVSPGGACDDRHGHLQGRQQRAGHERATRAAGKPSLEHGDEHAHGPLCSGDCSGAGWAHLCHRWMWKLLCEHCRGVFAGDQNLDDGREHAHSAWICRGCSGC